MFRGWFRSGLRCWFRSNLGCRFGSNLGCWFRSSLRCRFGSSLGCRFRSSLRCRFGSSLGCRFGSNLRCRFRSGLGCRFGSNLCFCGNLIRCMYQRCTELITFHRGHSLPLLRSVGRINFTSPFKHSTGTNFGTCSLKGILKGHFGIHCICNRDICC